MATVNFVNSSSYDIVLTRRGEQSGLTIKPVAQLPLDVSLGDIFDVSFPSQPKFGYRPIIINDLNVGTIIIYNGKIPLREVGSFGTLRLLRCRPNLLGFDFKKIKPRLVLDAFTFKPIFETLSTESIAYDFQEPYFIPQGLSYQPMQLSQGSSSVKLTYGYTSFANEWRLNIGVQGKDPESGVGGKLDFGYNQFSNAERESTNVYASIREQKAMYRVSIDPHKAYLDTEFIAAVESVTSVQEVKDKIIAQYGTHYPKTILYGGDRSVYMVMKQDTFAKATGFGVSIKAEVSQSADSVSGTKYTDKAGPRGQVTESSLEETHSSSEVVSGKLSFEYSQKENVKQLSSLTTNGYQIVGGTGGFDSWSVTDDNVVAVTIVDSDYLYNLIDQRVFKNSTSAHVLQAKKTLIQQAIAEHISNMPTLPSQVLPTPKTYAITLKSLEVIEEVDDANKKTKGKVQAIVTPPPVGFDGLLWDRPEFSEVNLKYKKGEKVTPLNATKRFFYPPSADGSFTPLQLVVIADIYEQDDLVNGEQRHLANSNFIDLSDLEEGEEIEFSFDCTAFATWAAWGTIRVTVVAARETSEFENPLFASPLFSLASNVDGRPTTTTPRLKFFQAVSPLKASQPETILKVDPRYKIISGGARVSYNPTGNLLTASFPRDAQTWVAKSKDFKSFPSPANIYVYAIAIEDPNNEWDVQIFQQTSTSINWPKATATVGSGYVLTGGGAQANWQDNGSFLTASYPDLPANATTATSWVASSKDHFVADVSTITAYAIGIKSKKGILLTTKVFTKTSASAAIPSTIALVDSGYTLVGGGAKVNWEGGLGNLLIKSFLGEGGWKAGSMNYGVPAPCTITAYAIGLKADV